MSLQRLSAKSIRRIERTIGESVARAWSNGGYWMFFETPDGRRGEWHRRTQEWRWYAPPPPRPPIERKPPKPVVSRRLEHADGTWEEWIEEVEE